MVVQAGIRRHRSAGGIICYSQKMPKAKVPATFGPYRSMAQKGIVSSWMQLVLECTLSFVVKTLNQKKIVVLHDTNIF